MRLMVVRYLYLWFSIFRYSMSRDMEYKTNFIGSLFVDSIYYIVWYYFFEIIYSKTDMLGSFNREDILVFLIATFFVDNNFLSLILSFCPGGIYEVAVIAIAFELDPDFVAFHHIIRLLMILFMVPIIIKILNKFNLKS